MTSQKNRRVEKAYIKKVFHEIACVGKLKPGFKKQFRSDILAFSKGKENVTEYMLCMEFGEPRELASSFYNKDECDTLLKHYKIKKVLLIILNIIAAVMLAFMIYVLTDAIKEKNSTWSEIITITDVQYNTTD